MFRLSELLGILENLKGKIGRQELGQPTYSMNVFQHLEDGGEFNSIWGSDSKAHDTLQALCNMFIYS